jgi:hypothetical protein
MSAPKYKSGRARELFLAQVAKMYLQGRYQWEIGEAVGVSQQAVSYALAQLQERWLRSSAADIKAVRSRQLARIDLIEREAWAEWERSKSGREVTAVETQRHVFDVEAEEGTSTQTNKRITRRKQRETKTGNPAYLSTLQWAVDVRYKMYGAPVEQMAPAANVYTPAPGMQEMTELLTDALDQLTPAERMEALHAFHELKALQAKFIRYFSVPSLTTAPDQPSDFDE